MYDVRVDTVTDDDLLPRTFEASYCRNGTTQRSNTPPPWNNVKMLM